MIPLLSSLPGLVRRNPLFLALLLFFSGVAVAAAQTNTPTNTLSPTVTDTITNTPTNSLTNTPVPPTFTFTPSFTATATNTAVNTLTPTFTVTNSATFTVTFTNTPTVTATATSTNSPTPTPSPTLTPSPTFTLTSTASPTSVLVIASTYTPTPTAPSPGGGCSGDIATYAYPNPATGNSVKVLFDLCEASSTRVLVYNAGGQLVGVYPAAGAATRNVLPLDISGYSHGVYFYIVKAEGSLGSRSSRPAKFSIIRSP